MEWHVYATVVKGYIGTINTMQSCPLSSMSGCFCFFAKLKYILVDLYDFCK